MEISGLFKNALSYPLSDYKKLLIVGIIGILASLSTFYSSFPGYNTTLNGILSIVALIFSFILAGYLLSVIKDAINGIDEIPDFEWKSNFVMGIKYLVMQIVYMIIPIIILVILTFATGLLESTYTIMNTMDVNLLYNVTTKADLTKVFAAVPQSAFDTFFTSLTITAVVTVIVALIFEFFSLIGACRLAETGRLADGLNIKQVFNDISAIGWGKVIVWYIVYIIILFILSAITGVIGMIPYVGIIIGALIISPFIVLFTGRAMGLLYADN